MMDFERPFAHFSDDQLQLVESACREFEKAIQNGVSFSIEQRIDQAPAELQGILLRDLVAIELEFWPNDKARPELHEFLQRFPGLDDEVRQAFFESDQSALPSLTAL